MKFLVRWAFRSLVLLAVLLVALILLKDVLFKSWAEYRIRTRTGMEVNIGRLELGLFQPTLTVEDLRLYNPAEFGGSPFLEIPDLHLECDRAALAWRQLHLRFLRLSIAEINIVEGRNGLTNLVLLQGASSMTGRGGSLTDLRFTGIDTLNLSVDTVRYSSLRRPSQATEVKVGLRNRILTNVHSVAELTNLVLNAAFQNGITITTAPPRGRRTTKAPPLEAGKPPAGQRR